MHGVYEREHDLRGEYALLSEHFYYFGDKPIALPEELQDMVQRTQGHRSVSNAPYLDPFLDWLGELNLPATWCAVTLRRGWRPLLRPRSL